MDLRDKELPIQLLKLILVPEETEANKSKKKKSDNLLEGYDLESIGKFV